MLTLGKKRKGNTQITDFGWAYVEFLIQQYWSPEQINGALKDRGWIDVVSTERIYLYIYENKANGGDLHKYLRCQKTYRKRGSANQDRRGQIIGKNHKGALLKLVDRVSKLIKIRPLANKNAQNLSNVSVLALSKWQSHSITVDNGKEFSNHYQISYALDIHIYFAETYSSWQRGTNENTNGLIRQFFPKNMKLDNISIEQAKHVEELLNNRPRKSFGFKTPLQVESRNNIFALTTGI